MTRSASPSPNPESRAGFTLIEVLAALVVTAAFVAVVLPFAGQLVRRWSTGETTIEAADAWMQAIARLSDDMTQTVSILDPQGQQKVLAFRIAPDVVKFVRPSLGGAGGPGLDVVTFRIESRPGGDRLLRQARPYNADFFADASGPGSAATILDGSYRLRFSAVGEDGKRTDTWNDPKIMPVRIDLSVTALDRAPVPPRPIVLPIAARGKGFNPVGPAKSPEL